MSLPCPGIATFYYKNSPFSRSDLASRRGQTIGFEFSGDIKGWPMKESGRIQIIVSDYADEVRDKKNIDTQWAVVRYAHRNSHGKTG